MTRSTVPGYLASAAALALSAAAPVAGVPNPGGTRCALEALGVVAAALLAVALCVLADEPQPAIRPPSATAATNPATALRWRRDRCICVIDIRPSSARRARGARAAAGRTPGTRARQARYREKPGVNSTRWSLVMHIAS